MPFRGLVLLGRQLRPLNWGPVAPTWQAGRVVVLLLLVPGSLRGCAILHLLEWGLVWDVSRRRVRLRSRRGLDLFRDLLLLL